MNKISFRAEKAIKILSNASMDAVSNIHKFKTFLECLRNTASKKTHYDNITDYLNPVYEYVHNELANFGFVTGEPEINKKNPDASLWWAIFGIVNSITFSPHLKTNVASHHASAYERNEALILELEVIINNISSCHI